jgi:hypothetical protein
VIDGVADRLQASPPAPGAGTPEPRAPDMTVNSTPSIPQEPTKEAPSDAAVNRPARAPAASGRTRHNDAGMQAVLRAIRHHVRFPSVETQRTMLQAIARQQCRQARADYERVLKEAGTRADLHHALGVPLLLLRVRRAEQRLAALGIPITRQEGR